MPGRASLYSLSVDWVSSVEALAPKKGVLRRSLALLALFCVLPSYYQASENWLTKGFKGPFVILRAHCLV